MKIERKTQILTSSQTTLKRAFYNRCNSVLNKSGHRTNHLVHFQTTTLLFLQKTEDSHSYFLFVCLLRLSTSFLAGKKSENCVISVHVLFRQIGLEHERHWRQKDEIRNQIDEALSS
jgi:hypothetical protein